MTNLDKALPTMPHRKEISLPRRLRQRTATPEPVTLPAAAEIELQQIEAARQHPHAFEPLYLTHVDLVWSYALSRLGDTHRAADATSLTFQRALAALPGFEPRRDQEGTTFRAWLMTIARNVVIDETRRRPTASLDDPTRPHRLIDPARSPEDEAILNDDVRQVKEALARLPDIPRQIVELRSFGLRMAEIATMLNMSEPAVKTAHSRACSRLRTLLTVPEAQEPQP